MGFVGQLQLELRSRDPGDGPRELRFRPRLRRVRLLLLGSVFSRTLRYYVQLSTAPGSLELMDFWIDWRPLRGAHLRLGQQKLGLSRYRLGSFKGLALVDWPVISPAFGDERQIGAMVASTGDKPAWLAWSAGVFTGVNQRATHAVGIARTFGEPVSNPSDLTNPAPVNAFHPEVVARVGYTRGRLPGGTNIDWQGGALRLYSGVGAAWDLNADPTREHALRLVAELALQAHHATLLASAYLGWARRPEGGRLDLDWGQWGVLAQAGYVFARRVSLAIRYALVQTSAGLRATARTRADDRIAAAPDADTRAALENQYASAGMVREQHELGIGLVLRLLGGTVLWATDASWLPVRRTDGTRHDMLVRTQLQVAF